jgi:hypothetical protein
MNKAKALKVLNPVLAIVFLFQALSGLLPAVVPYNAHRAGGIALVIGIGLHLFLNWGWIRANFLKRRKRNNQV